MENKVKQIMGQVFRVDPAGIDDKTVQTGIGTWDSLAHMNLIVALEEEFGVQFQDSEIVQMTSYPAILDRLKALTKG